ncbi:IS110 family transposase [Rhodococcus sp. USK13]|nr:IS110 family transposase [Rhodococcus sp. USK13]
MGIACGIDWAEAHHDVALVDTNGEIIAHTELTPAQPDSLISWH